MFRQDHSKLIVAMFLFSCLQDMWSSYSLGHTSMQSHSGQPFHQSSRGGAPGGRCLSIPTLSCASCHVCRTCVHPIPPGVCHCGALGRNPFLPDLHKDPVLNDSPFMLPDFCNIPSSFSFLMRVTLVSCSACCARCDSVFIN